MFNWQLASKLFDGFTILRWTDFIRPIEYVEIEKHAIQSALTYIIGKEYEENSKQHINWSEIVKNNVFGFLSKIATSDIKEPIHLRLKNDSADKLNEIILEVYFLEKSEESVLFPANTITKKEFITYLKNKQKPIKSVEERIGYFAHKYATYSEFNTIKEFNKQSPDIGKVNTNLTDALNLAYDNKDGFLTKIFDSLRNHEGHLYSLLTYFEKLRPQVRWSQTCRMPRTTVLGHSMYVAVLTYFAVRELLHIDDNLQGNELTNRILVDCFYAALFHDLPESLTRDIISPIKNKIDNSKSQLDDEKHNLIAHYEYEEINENLIEKINGKKWANDLKNLLGEQKIGDIFVFRPFRDRPEEEPTILGNLIEYMDKIAAYIEAKMSVDIGINSIELQNGIKRIIDGLYGKEYKYPKKTSRLASRSILKLNDFFASMPHYTIGPSV